jgi:hypothetical protein
VAEAPLDVGDQGEGVWFTGFLPSLSHGLGRSGSLLGLTWRYMPIIRSGQRPCHDADTLKMRSGHAGHGRQSVDAGQPSDQDRRYINRIAEK